MQEHRRDLLNTKHDGGSAIKRPPLIATYLLIKRDCRGNKLAVWRENFQGLWAMPLEQNRQAADRPNLLAPLCLLQCLTSTRSSKTLPWSSSELGTPMPKIPSTDWGTFRRGWGWGRV